MHYIIYKIFSDFSFITQQHVSFLVEKFSKMQIKPK